MFAALIAKTDIDLIALDKGETTARSIVDELITKMEQYANFGFDFIEEQLENDPNYFFKESAFLRVFTSFLTEQSAPDTHDDEPEPLNDDEPEPLDSSEDDKWNHDESFDEEAMRAEAEKPWNEDDIERLKFYFDRQMEPSRIAERLGKSIYSVQFQLSQLGLISMPLNVIVKNSGNSGMVINQTGDIVYEDEAPLKIFNEKIYRFKKKTMCMTVKEIKRADGAWVKGPKLLVAYSDTDLYSKLSRLNFIDDIEDFVEGNTREENKIKVKGLWYDYYGERS